MLVSNQYCVGYEQVLRNTPLQVIFKTVLLFHKHKRKKKIEKDSQKDSQYLFNKNFSNSNESTFHIFLRFKSERV